MNISRTIFLTTILAMIGCSEKTNTDDTGGVEVNEISETDTSTTSEDVGPAIWSGERIIFVKEDSADHTDPVNQDAITNLVILTRAEQGSLMNMVTENTANSSSPAGTEWAMGSTEELDELDFKTLKAAVNNNMKDAPGIPLVLHLTEEDIYIDVTFLSWTSGGSGSGFSYERSTENE